VEESSAWLRRNRKRRREVVVCFFFRVKERGSTDIVFRAEAGISLVQFVTSELR